MTYKRLVNLLNRVSGNKNYVLELTKDSYYVLHGGNEYKYCLLQRNKRLPDVYIDEVLYCRTLQQAYDFVKKYY